MTIRSFREGVKKIDFVWNMYPKLFSLPPPVPLSQLEGDKKIKKNIYFFMNILLEPVPVLRQGGEYTETLFNKKGF